MSRNASRFVVGFGLALTVLLVVTGCGSAGQSAAPSPAGTQTAPVAHKCSFYPKSKPRPQTCISAFGGYRCSAYGKAGKPLDCLSTAQIVQEKRAARRAAAHAKWLAKKQAAEAKREAAARRAANAWHRGYFEQSGGVYWKWVDGRSCVDYATDGCWHVEVITKYGCQSYVAVNANEYEGRAIVGQLLANQGYGIPPKTPRIFELDADTRSVTAGNVSIDCE